MRRWPTMFIRWPTTSSRVSRRWQQSNRRVYHSFVLTSTPSSGKSRTHNHTGQSISSTLNRLRTGVQWPPQLGRRSSRRPPTIGIIMNQNPQSQRWRRVESQYRTRLERVTQRACWSPRSVPERKCMLATQKTSRSVT